MKDLVLKGEMSIEVALQQFNWKAKKMLDYYCGDWRVEDVGFVRVVDYGLNGVIDP